MDVSNTKCKLEKGLKTLEFLDTNINSLSIWLTEVEQKLDEVEDTQLTNKNIENQVKYINVRFVSYIFMYIILYLKKMMFYSYLQHTLEVDCEKWEKVKNSINTHCIEFKSLKDPLCEDDTYREHADTLFDRWTLVLNRLQKKLTQLKVSLIEICLCLFKIFIEKCISFLV